MIDNIASNPSNMPLMGTPITGKVVNHLNAARLRTFGETFDGIGRAMCRQSIHFERYFVVVQPLTSFLHHGQIARATHNNANDWCHNE